MNLHPLPVARIIEANWTEDGSDRYAVPPDLFQRTHANIGNWYAFLQAEMDYPPVMRRPSRWPRIRHWLWERTQAALLLSGVILLCCVFAGLAALAILLTT